MTCLEGVAKDYVKHLGNIKQSDYPISLDTPIAHNFLHSFARRLPIVKLLIALCCVLLISTKLAHAAELDSSLSIQKKTIEASQQSQKKIGSMADKTLELAAEYRSTLHKINSLKIYNAQLEKIVESQRQEISSLDKQLDEVDVTQKEIVPLLLKMLDTLERFVQLDTPFLIAERNSRMHVLRQLMNRADITLSEKYRRAIEAYQIEVEYGRTIEAYEGASSASADNRTVELLRIGRIGFYFLSLDGTEVGF